MTLADSIKRDQGISLFEMFLVVAFLAILGSIGFVTVSDVVGGTKQTKLLSDVKALNSAVLGYIASNGDLSSAKTPQEVIAKLKSVSSNSRYNGIRQSFIDARIDIDLQSEKESSKSSLRAYWDRGSSRFIVASSGPPGIKAFTLDDSLVVPEEDKNKEDRAGILSLAQEDPWIWDFVEAAPSYQAGPTIIPTSAAPPTSVAPAPVATPAAVAPITPLSDPIFSIPPGSYPFTNYDLNVTILNPNPAGSSDIYYRIGFGSWQRYTGSTILTQPGTNIQAQAISNDSKAFENRSVNCGTYEASPILLRAPLITPDNPEFVLFGDVDIQVSISDDNLPGSAIVEFRVGGSPWMEYKAPFLLPAANFPGGAEIEARAVSAGSPYYLTSLTTLEFILIEGVNLSGNTVGEFSNAQRPTGMVTNLKHGKPSSYFE